MRILTRSTVFETVVMRSLFWCVLALAVAFSSVPAQAQGFEDLPGSNIVPAITADQVGTSKEHLKEFVEAAVDAYYIEFLIRRHCDFWEPVTPEDRELITSFLLTNFPQYDISDLTPESIKTLSTEQIKKLIPILTNLLIARDPNANPWEGCDVARTSEFHPTLRSEDGPWREDPIYLFILDDNAVLHLDGADESLEGVELDALDQGGRRVEDEIIKEVRNPGGDGFVEYCWDDPTVEDDNFDSDGNTSPQESALGNSWKISYVVDPIGHLGLLPIPGFPRHIFGSGIYPKDGNPLSGCRIVVGDGEEESDDDVTEELGDVSADGGCGIAGSSGISQGTAFGLLLTVPVLFLAVSLVRGRAMGKRNAVRS